MMTGLVLIAMGMVLATALLLWSLLAPGRRRRHASMGRLRGTVRYGPRGARHRDPFDRLR